MIHKKLSTLKFLVYFSHSDIIEGRALINVVIIIIIIFLYLFFGIVAKHQQPKSYLIAIILDLHSTFS